MVGRGGAGEAVGALRMLGVCVRSRLQQVKQSTRSGEHLVSS